MKRRRLTHAPTANSCRSISTEKLSSNPSKWNLFSHQKMLPHAELISFSLRHTIVPQFFNLISYAFVLVSHIIVVFCVYVCLSISFHQWKSLTRIFDQMNKHITTFNKTFHSHDFPSSTFRTFSPTPSESDWCWCYCYYCMLCICKWTQQYNRWQIKPELTHASHAVVPCFHATWCVIVSVSTIRSFSSGIRLISRTILIICCE